MSRPDVAQVPVWDSPRSEEVRNVRALRQPRIREARSEFLLENPHVVFEAVEAFAGQGDGTRGDQRGPVVGRIKRLYIADEVWERFPALVELASARKIPIRRVTSRVLAAMSDTVSSQGVLGVCGTVDIPLARVMKLRPKLLAFLSRVQDPGNAGTLVRAAHAAGADAVLFSPECVDLYNPKLVRSTTGSLFGLPIVRRVDPKTFVDLCATYGLGVLAADPYGSVNLDELQDAAVLRRLGSQHAFPSYDLTGPTAWLFGNEAQGLSQQELGWAQHRVVIPHYGNAESLNIGAAATVCLYASARAQRPSF